MQRTWRRVVTAVVGSVVISILSTLVVRRLLGRQKRPAEVPGAELPVFDSAQGRTEIERAYQAVLDQWPVPYVQRHLPTRFGVTHVIESGPPKAPAIVLLHAYFATAAAWYRTVGALSRDHRVVAIDVIGDANLSRPVRPITSLDEYDRWFVEVLDGLGVTTLSLAGNSFGGFLATHFAIEMPERVTKLVLIGPASTFRVDARLLGQDVRAEGRLPDPAVAAGPCARDARLRGVDVCRATARSGMEQAVQPRAAPRWNRQPGLPARLLA